MKDTKNRVNSYPMSELAPVITDFLKQNKEVIITGRGNSMRPLIRNRKDHLQIVAYKGEELAPGDVIFYRRDNGRYVIHRIVGVAPDGSFVLKGDCQTVAERGITRRHIIGRVTAVIRGGRVISFGDKGYLRYARFWTRSVFFRSLHEKLFYLLIRIKRFIH